MGAIGVIIRAGERAARWLLEGWRGLSVHAKVVGAVAVANWLLLFANHTTAAATNDQTLWPLFPGIGGAAPLAIAAVSALSYPARPTPPRRSFTPAARAARPLPRPRRSSRPSRPSRSG